MTKHLINGKPIKKEPPNNSKKIVIEDWVLEKSYEPKAVWCHNKGDTGGYISDFEKMSKEYRVVGTKKQIAKELAKDKWDGLDEVYSYEPFDKKHTYFKDICFSDNPEYNLPTRKEYNKKFLQDLKEYKELYTKNKNKLLILRTN